MPTAFQQLLAEFLAGWGSQLALSRENGLLVLRMVVPGMHGENVAVQWQGATLAQLGAAIEARPGGF